MQQRILAIDFGTERMGLAVSDPGGTVALGLPTLQRTNLAADLAAIEDLIRDYGVSEIVLGRPLSKSGAENPMSKQAAAFAAKLRKRIEFPLRLWDERLSSAEANHLLRSSGRGPKSRRQAVDRMAATLILQSYLDWRTMSKAVDHTPARQDGQEP